MTADPILPWLFVVRFGLNATALLAIGLALHASLGILSPTDRRAALKRAGAAAIGVLLFGAARLAVLNGQMTGGLADAFNPETFALTWLTLGHASLTLGLGAGAIIVAALTGIRLVAIAGALAIAGAFALTGHTQGLEHPGLAPAAVAAHVLIAGFWVAAPLTLWPRRGLGDATLLGRLKRFSAIAMAAIPVLVGLGLWLAWVLAGGFSGLLGTTYGQLLLAKFAVTMIAVAMGALNHQIVTGMVEATPARGRTWLARTLSTEAVVFLIAVLIVSAATTFTGAGEH
ncbi:MAG: CopD family protein [Alphaproteobacteria bacterium]